VASEASARWKGRKGAARAGDRNRREPIDELNCSRVKETPTVIGLCLKNGTVFKSLWNYTIIRLAWFSARSMSSPRLGNVPAEVGVHHYNRNLLTIFLVAINLGETVLDGET